MTVYLLLGLTLGFVASVQPGPFLAYLINLTLTGGWRRAVPAAFAPLLSDGPAAVLMLAVLSTVPGGVVRWLHVAGGCFLAWLAVAAVRSWRRDDAARLAGAPPPQRSVLQAAAVNLLNPALYVGWGVVLGPVVLRGWRESPPRGVVMVAVFYATMIATNVAVVLLFHQARRLGPRVTRALVGVSAFGLAGVAAYQLWLGVRG